jgi:tetratricopeptide (TPR) repeat protein
MHYELEKPTPDVDLIGRAIGRLKVDGSGTENTMHALQDVINHYSVLIKKDRRLLVVLVTDESGDDGSYVEEAHQAAMEHRVPVYVIGRQSLFGYDRARLRYVDPVTKDVYWPSIRRGPETADVELLQWDGLHVRWDEQPSGFAPYELARIAKDTGGIYFLLPSEEEMRVRQREKAYSIATLKEYIPEYDNRLAYTERRNKSEFRRTLYEIIDSTRGFPFRQHFPIAPDEMVPLANQAGQLATERLQVLLAIQRRLESLQKLRDREPMKRWQAHYDLMLAQIVTYQVKAYEYRACLAEMVRTLPKPKKMPTPDLRVVWDLHHSKTPKAPKEETAKKYAEAQRLLRRVIELHPNTPWADLAQDELNRGLSVQRNEWAHSPRYEERAKLVPKY